MMAAAKTNTSQTTEPAPAPEVAPAPVPEASLQAETERVGEFTLVHKGFGRYGVEGHKKEFASREDALAYLRDLEAVAAFQAQYGDLIPAGVDINPRTVEFRGTLSELPMNELYLPDGTRNPWYDREWLWGWGRATGDDVSTKQARGYRVVTRDTLEKLVADGKVPEHYRSLLMPVDHGNRLQYGDLVLMRMPRILWRQLQAAEEEAALRRVRLQDAQQHEVLDRAGVKNVSGPISNEMSSGLKMSGF